MPISLNGSNGLTFNDGSTQASAASALNNRLINAGFIINQRSYVSGTSLSSGTYAHDRWKAGASGCTYTFTQGNLGVPITITITAGSLQQVIEGCHVPEGGTYTLSWQGTAQARVNGGTYSASPLVVSALTAGANATVEFNSGTVIRPKFETGSVASSFDYRPYGTEFDLCQRYYYVGPSSVYGYPSPNSGGYCFFQRYDYKVTMRAAATVVTSYSSLGNVSSINAQTRTADFFVDQIVSTVTTNTTWVASYTASAEL